MDEMEEEELILPKFKFKQKNLPILKLESKKNVKKINSKLPHISKYKVQNQIGEG